MKEKKSRRSLVIILLIFVGIIAIGLTAAAVYASRYMSQGVSAFLSEFTDVKMEPLAQGGDVEPESSTIYDQGVLVTGVVPNGPAQQAGIRRGTIILAVDGEEVTDLAQLMALLAEKGSGAAVSMTVINSPTPEEITVTLAAEPPLLGVTIADAGFESSGGQFPKDFDLSNIPDEFRFDPGNMPFTPEDFGFGQGAVPSGVMVADVVAGSAAESAGLMVGDVIEIINDQEVSSVEQLVELLAGLDPGDKADLTITRDGEKEDIAVTLGENPDRAGLAFLGIQPAPLRRGPGSMGGRGRFGPLGIPFQGEMPTGGAVIVTVVEDSPAAAAGLQKGDIVEGVDGQPVTTVDELIQMVSEKSPGDKMTLTLLREGQTEEVEIILASNPDDSSRAYLGVHLGAMFNVDLNELGDGQGTLPEEFFYQLQPNFDPSQQFDLPGSLQDLIPDNVPGNSGTAQDA